MPAVVAYFRILLADTSSAREALAEQQAAFASWVTTTKADVVGEFIEQEDRGHDRPRLAAAIACCRLHKARLVIASTAPIDGGPEFSPRIVSVPVTVLPQRPRRAPEQITMSTNSGSDVCLRVGEAVGHHLPLYVCNPKAHAILNVVIFGAGLYLGARRARPTGTSHRSFESVGARTCQLLELRNVYLEGDFLDCLEIRFEDAGEQRRGRVWLRNLLVRRSAIKISFD